MPWRSASLALIKIRNEHPAFAGEFTAQGGENVCCLMWKLEQQSISLSIDFTSRTALITEVNGAQETTLNLQSLLV